MVSEQINRILMPYFGNDRGIQILETIKRIIWKCENSARSILVKFSQYEDKVGLSTTEYSIQVQYLSRKVLVQLP